MKPNTASPLYDQEELQQETAPSFFPAPLGVRAIAAVVDYLTVSSLLFFTASQVGYSDLQFLIPLVIGAIYYSVGNSSVTGGQTLGKKVFGLRTLLLREPSSPKYLSLGRSFVRFLISLGLLILLAELPPLFYRAYRVVGSSNMLELHMLVTLSLFLTNVSVLIFHPVRRALHDTIAGTIVVRASDIPAPQKRPLTTPIKPTTLALAVFIGTTLGFVFWSLGRVHDTPTAQLNAYRYPIEASLPLRILSVAEADNGIEIFAIILPHTTEDYRDIALELGKLSVENADLQSGAVENLRLRFIAPHLEAEREFVFTYDITTQELS